MLKDITLGQYFPGKTVVHRLDPRTKLVLVFAFTMFMVAFVNIYMHVSINNVVGTIDKVYASNISLNQLLDSLDDLMDAATPLPPDDPDKSVLSDVCVRAAATAGLSIFDRDDFSKLARTPFAAALEAACTRVSKPLYEPVPIEWLEGGYYERKDDLSALVHHWFFSGLHQKRSSSA